MSHFDEAIGRIQTLVGQASVSELREPTAMSVATTDLQGKPSVRTLLLKQVDEQGLVFFTNLNSNKAQHIQATPFAAICIYIQDAHQQIQVEGPVKQITSEESDAYWQSRPRASQIGAWASRQSEVMADQQMLLNRIARYEEEFADRDVPRPSHWGGYRVTPERIEFWSGHPNRLNQRDNYCIRDGQWIKELLYP